MKKSFGVLNVRCEGCAHSIKKALAPYFDFIEIDLTKEPRIVTVDIKSGEKEEQFKNILRSLGYPLCEDEFSSAQNIGYKTKSLISCAVGKLF